MLEKHWPDVPKYGDIRQLRGDELEPVDLIAGGFPCQPVSLAGKRKAQKDERWLWPEFARIVRVVRPKYVLVENVPGLLIRGMGDVLGDLAALGYDAEWFVLSAAHFGAPHLRERVFIVAYPPGFGCHQGPLVFTKAIHQESSPMRTDWWASEPGVGRVAHGTAHRVERIRGLGNAVVPQVAEFIGRAIMKAERRRRDGAQD